MAGKTALLLGATGETGRELLRELAHSTAYNKVISVTRREVELPKEEAYKKVEQRVVDFDRLAEHGAVFQDVDKAFCCLGTTRAKSGKEGFVKVDHDYVLQAAQELKSRGCDEFHLLTSQGSNPNSWFLYISTKGLVEEAVKRLNFSKVAIYRPGILLCHREESRFFESLLQNLARAVDGAHRWSVPTSLVAKAMLATSLIDGDGVRVLEHADIVRLAGQSP